ncbi:MAG: hypothetical protein NVS4B12_12940 [Ktedonobacteraceae bacterium]
MKEDSTLFSLSPDAYAEYLEQLSNDEFWHHAYEKAHVSRPTHSMQALASITSTPDDHLTCITGVLRTAQCVLPLSVIREILPTSQYLTRLPDTPFWMLGILSWRGETIAAIDLCSYLTKSSSFPLQERTTLIVQHENLLLALCVLSVSTTVTVVNLNHVTPFTLPPAIEGGETPIGIVGMWEHADVQQETIFVLDIPALFKDALQCIERKDGRG